MGQFGHFCMDCAYKAYGMCLFYKATVKERACSLCTNFVNATDADAVTSELESRNKEENVTKRSKEDELAIEHLLCLRDAKSVFRHPSTKVIYTSIGEPPQMWPKKPTEKWVQFVNRELARLMKERTNKQTNQDYVLQFTEKQSISEPTQSHLVTSTRKHEQQSIRKKNMIYAMSLGDESFLNLHLKVDKERKSLQAKIRLIENKLQSAIHLAKIHLPASKDGSRRILEKLNELLEIIQVENK